MRGARFPAAPTPGTAEILLGGIMEICLRGIILSVVGLLMISDHRLSAIAIPG